MSKNVSRYYANSESAGCVNESGPFFFFFEFDVTDFCADRVNSISCNNSRAINFKLDCLLINTLALMFKGGIICLFKLLTSK